MGMRRTGLKYLGLGALTALGWLVATGVDLYSVPASSVSAPLLDDPLWTRVALRAVLVLSVPALALLLHRRARSWLGHRLGFALALLLPAVLIAALPALVPCPWTRPEEGLAAPLHVPTASLGIALGVIDRIRVHKSGQPTPGDGEDEGDGAGGVEGDVPGAVLCILGFALLLLVAGVALTVLALQTGSCTGYGCSLRLVVIMGFGLLAVVSLVTGIVAGWIGYVAGLGLVRLAKNAPVPNGR